MPKTGKPHPQLGPQLDPGFAAPPAYAAPLANAQAFIAQEAPLAQQLNQILSSVNLTQYLPGCGIDVTTALSLLARITNLAGFATQAAVSAFASTGCNVPPNLQALISAAQNTKPRWNTAGIGGLAYGTSATSGSGGGVCLDMNEYYPSVMATFSAAAKLVAALPAAIQQCLATKDQARQGGVVRHIGPVTTIGTTVAPGVNRGQIPQL